MLSDTLLLVAALVSVTAVRAAPTAKPPLQFTANGTFHISVFNDIHFGENASGQGRLWDMKTSTIMASVMDAEKPQLVVLNGDLISGDQYQGADILDHIDRIVKPIVARRLPWASTYGNHDSNYNLSRDQMLQREKTYNGSYTERMVEGKNAGVTNYYLPVYAADSDCDASSQSGGSGCVPELLMWFFDSRGGAYYRTHDRQPDWVDTTVVDWFTKTSAQLATRYGRVVPSIAFVHIPIHAAAVLEKQGPGGRVDPRRHPGVDDDKINGQSSHDWIAKNGTEKKVMGYGGHDVPFMKALAAARGLQKGLDVGFADGATGLHLCYGQHTGYGGYGNWIRGGRQIVVTREKLRNGTLDTHTRLETGEVVGAVTLNATFNEDLYEEVPDTRTSMVGPPEQGKGKGVGNEAAGMRPALGMSLTAAISVLLCLCFY
ncbi:hypothetical protein LLEC1_03673 [Akanthomyces lecanii]|uniref:Calcineurin-like phosphoesterase domain-containing protein n=1 Tax=Cordyceps confragosa TaxID=2714763 RepID=A0A179IB01_CORDF|nr:hypothetical protein LLEC1_03673 [Akanthomyces lecanii]